MSPPRAACCMVRRLGRLRNFFCACILVSLVAIATYRAAVGHRDGERVFAPQHHSLSKDANLHKRDFHAILSSLPKSQNNSATHQCQTPQLPLYNKFIIEHRPAAISADPCSRHEANWLRVTNGRVHVNAEFTGAACTAEPIVWVGDDRSSEFGRAQPIANGSDLPSIGFRATCTGPSGRSHKSVYYGVKRMQLPNKKTASDEAENIVILGLDSLSRLESLRSLRRVSDLMRVSLGGVSLMHYNILGDGTPAALLPILTGIKEEDMPEGRKGFKTARHLDETMRWLFQDIRELGFASLYGEEENDLGTFQLRFLGFKKQPVDFYLRPILQQQEALQKSRICIGNEISSGRMLEAVKDLFRLYPERPKFAFTFFAALSHENQDLTPMDSELSKFVEWFIKENLNRNSTLIFMSDHGQRHGPMRNSMQGKLEESLPLMTIALSQQLMTRKPGSLRQLKQNALRLTTPVDIHKTLLSIAGVGRGGGGVGAHSLIDDEVPEGRGCPEAGVPAHWCSCLSRIQLENPGSNQLALRAARYAVAQINSATSQHRAACAELQLLTVTDAEASLASNDLAKRHRLMRNYFSVNVQNDDVVASGYVTVRFVTSPSSGLYEASVQFALNKGRKFSVQFASVSEASRINKYGSQADCIAAKLPHLRKFCFCKNMR